MRLPCHLRVIRGERTMHSIARASGVNQGQISKIENGIALAKDSEIPALERAYGAKVEDWYPRRFLLAFEGDGDDLRDIRIRMHRSLLPEHPSGTCRSCEGAIEESLTRLGSTQCHDCRGTPRP